MVSSIVLSSMTLTPDASVFGSVTLSTPTTAAHAFCGFRFVFSNARLTVNATSLAVNGWPSCHLTPGWRWNVHFRPSGLMSHESARSGTGSQPLPSSFHFRSTSLSNISWKFTAWLNVSCHAGCQIAVRSPSQCIWSVSAAVPPLAGGALLAAVVGAVLGGAVALPLGADEADD